MRIITRQWVLVDLDYVDVVGPMITKARVSKI